MLKRRGKKTEVRKEMTRPGFKSFGAASRGK
jgi:hypothetical protein